jgi:hypothetical protein
MFQRGYPNHVWAQRLYLVAKFKLYLLEKLNRSTKWILWYLANMIYKERLHNLVPNLVAKHNG